MRLLLDTQLLVWTASLPDEVPARAKFLIEDCENDLFFSAINIWEVAIKYALGRPDFALDPRVLRRLLLANGFDELPLNGEHSIAVGKLPPIHGDPFDRVLIAQAATEAMTLLTTDRKIARYPGDIIKV